MGAFIDLEGTDEFEPDRAEDLGEITSLEAGPTRTADLAKFCDADGTEDGVVLPRPDVRNFFCGVLANLPIFPPSFSFGLTSDCLLASVSSDLSAVTPSNGNPF
jgi:hypothetical protein